MYIVRVIPLKRKIPGGELTYISKEPLNIGDIVLVPLKKSFEQVLVVEQNDVSKEKEYIKSISFKLTTLATPEIISKIDKKVLKTILDFATYSICQKDKIIRSLFNKLKFNKFDLSKEIVLESPKRLSVYGKNYLGFDPVVFFILLAHNLKIPIYFGKSSYLLAYKEWDIKPDKETTHDSYQIDIIIRDEEDHIDKANPLSKELLDILKKNTLSKKRILIVSSIKNFAPKSICHDCKTIHICDKCNKPLVLVKNNRNYAKKYGIAGDYIYVCSNCNTASHSIAKCRNCDSWHLVPLGYGTERIVEQLQNSLSKPDFKTVYDMTERIGVKNLKLWNDQGGIVIIRPNYISEIQQSDIAIIPSISPLIYSKSFESAESARNLMSELTLTSHEIHLTVMNQEEKYFLEEDSATWQKNEITDRKDLYYPPYARYIKIELDSYTSKSYSIIDAVFKIVEKLAIPGTVSKDKNYLLNVTIEASFDFENWSLFNNNYKTAEILTNALSPFLNHLKIEVS